LGRRGWWGRSAFARGWRRWGFCRGSGRPVCAIWGRATGRGRSIHRRYRCHCLIHKRRKLSNFDEQCRTRQIQIFFGECQVDDKLSIPVPISEIVQQGREKQDDSLKRSETSPTVP
jgi:hypothetical protein